MEQQLIENALALCGNTTRYVYEYPEIDNDNISIEKFCYYLLDRKFLIKYYQNQKPGYLPSTDTTELMSGEFGYAIMEYQSGNEKPLIELLNKIKGQ